MNNQVKTFRDVSWKNHSALGDKGVQGLVTIGKYELSIVGGEGLYSTKGDRDWYKPNQSDYYVSFEVAVFEDNNEGGQDMTNRFFTGDFDDGGNGTLGWQSQYQINALISKIEDALKQKVVYYNNHNLKQTEEFDEFLKDNSELDYPKVKAIADRHNNLNLEEKKKYEGFLLSGWTKDIVKLNTETEESDYVQIIKDTKVTIRIIQDITKMQIKYTRYDEHYGMSTPTLKDSWISVEDGYGSGYRSRKNGKFKCYSIVGADRQYTPAGLLKKTKETNENNTWSFDRYMEERRIFKLASEELTEKYPKASLTMGENRRTYTKDQTRIKATLPSGSSIEFTLYNYEEKGLRLEKAIDSQVLNFDTWEGWADRFNNQKVIK